MSKEIWPDKRPEAELTRIIFGIAQPMAACDTIKAKQA
jgi:hypothetical protein